MSYSRRSSNRNAKIIAQEKTPGTYFDDEENIQEEYQEDGDSADLSSVFDNSSMEMRIMPMGKQGKNPASKRIATEEVQSPLLTSRSAPREDLRHRQDSLRRMANERAIFNREYTGRSRLESSKMKVLPK